MAIVNSAAMNTGVHVYFSIMVFSGYIPSSGIAGIPQVAQLVKNLPAMQGTWVRSLGWEDSLEKGKATHSSILAWRTPWTIQLQRVRHD